MSSVQCSSCFVNPVPGFSVPGLSDLVLTLSISRIGSGSGFSVSRRSSSDFIIYHASDEPTFASLSWCELNSAL